jgi:hypothetical protein
VAWCVLAVMGLCCTQHLTGLEPWGCGRAIVIVTTITALTTQHITLLHSNLHIHIVHCAGERGHQTLLRRQACCVWWGARWGVKAWLITACGCAQEGRHVNVAEAGRVCCVRLTPQAVLCVE